MKELFTFIAVTLGRRYKTNQKKSFTDYVAKEFKSIGYKIRIDDQTAKGKKMINLFVGEVKNAKTIIMAGYDTPPSGVRIAKEYYPFDYKRNKRSAIYNLAAQAIISVILLALIPLGFLMFWNDVEMVGRVVLVLLGVIVLGCMYLVGGGSGNPVNFNRNSAALTVMMEFARKKKVEDVAFAFIDKTCVGFEGYKATISRLGKDESKYDFIILDCVGYGESTEIICTTDALARLETYEDLTNITIRTDEEALPINLFTKGIQISGGSKDERGDLVVKNTGNMRDTEVDMEYMQMILELVKKLSSKGGKI